MELDCLHFGTKSCALSLYLEMFHSERVPQRWCCIGKDGLGEAPLIKKLQERQ